MNILITGAAGKIGSTLVEGLRGKYRLRGFDRDPMPGLEDAVTGDLEDFDAVLTATRDMDAVIHLAGFPGGAGTWEQVLQSNIVGAYHVFEAARQNGVRRIAYASRAGILSPYPQAVKRTVDLLPRPETYYSVGKVFGENLGYMYAHRFDMEVVCVRIGNFKRERPFPEHPHHLSHADAVRVFERAVIHPGVTFEVVFGVSDSTWPLYDLEHGRNAIGYAPQDRSEVLPEGE